MFIVFEFHTISVAIKDRLLGVGVSHQIHSIAAAHFSDGRSCTLSQGCHLVQSACLGLTVHLEPQALRNQAVECHA